MLGFLMFVREGLLCSYVGVLQNYDPKRIRSGERNVKNFTTKH